jgi:hypothetical protein
MKFILTISGRIISGLSNVVVVRFIVNKVADIWTSRHSSAEGPSTSQRNLEKAIDTFFNLKKTFDKYLWIFVSVYDLAKALNLIPHNLLKWADRLPAWLVDWFLRYTTDRTQQVHEGELDAGNNWKKTKDLAIKLGITILNSVSLFKELGCLINRTFVVVIQSEHIESFINTNFYWLKSLQTKWLKILESVGCA